MLKISNLRQPYYIYYFLFFFFIIIVILLFCLSFYIKHKSTSHLIQLVDNHFVKCEARIPLYFTRYANLLIDNELAKCTNLRKKFLRVTHHDFRHSEQNTPVPLCRFWLSVTAYYHVVSVSERPTQRTNTLKITILQTIFLRVCSK